MVKNSESNIEQTMGYIIQSFKNFLEKKLEKSTSTIYLNCAVTLPNAFAIGMGHLIAGIGKNIRIPKMLKNK